MEILHYVRDSFDYFEWATAAVMQATVREFYEIENHKNKAFYNMLEHLENNDKLLKSITKEIHADLTDRLQYDKCQFKKNENMIRCRIPNSFTVRNAISSPTVGEWIIGWRTQLRGRKIRRVYWIRIFNLK